MSPTRAQVVALREEAAVAGDLAMVAICETVCRELTAQARDNFDRDQSLWTPAMRNVATVLRDVEGQS